MAAIPTISLCVQVPEGISVQFKFEQKAAKGRAAPVPEAEARDAVALPIPDQLALWQDVYGHPVAAVPIDDDSASDVQPPPTTSVRIDVGDGILLLDKNRKFIRAVCHQHGPQCTMQRSLEMKILKKNARIRGRPIGTLMAWLAQTSDDAQSHRRKEQVPGIGRRSSVLGFGGGVFGRSAR
jgi:hypothetical protein